MQRRHAVDLVRSDEGEVAHAHAAARLLINQRERAQQARIDEAATSRAVEMGRVDEIDDLHVARQQTLHQRHRPALQSLGQQRVVGVGEGRLRDRPGLVPLEAVEVDQNAHQLGDRDCGMGVVELDGGVISERADVLVLLDVAANEVKQGSGSKEILLPQAQFLAGGRGVTWIEHLGDRLGPHRVRQRADEIAGVEGVELERIRGARRPKAERVHVFAAPADDRRVVGDRLDRLAGVPDMARTLVVALHHFDRPAEADRITVFGALELPRIAVDKPILGRFLLPSAPDDLPEEPVVVANAIAVGGDSERRHAVHETGGETSKAAVAERCVRLDPAQFGEAHAEFLQRLLHRLGDPDIRHRIEQEAADQEFERKVIDPFAPVVIGGVGRDHPPLDNDVAGGEGDGEKPVARTRCLRNLADRIGQLRQHRSLEFRRCLGAPFASFGDLDVVSSQIVHGFSPAVSADAVARLGPIF